MDTAAARPSRVTASWWNIASPPSRKPPSIRDAETSPIGFPYGRTVAPPPPRQRDSHAGIASRRALRTADTGQESRADDCRHARVNIGHRVDDDDVQHRVWRAHERIALS